MSNPKALLDYNNYPNLTHDEENRLLQLNGAISEVGRLAHTVHSDVRLYNHCLDIFKGREKPASPVSKTEAVGWLIAPANSVAMSMANLSWTIEAIKDKYAPQSRFDVYDAVLLESAFDQLHASFPDLSKVRNWAAHTSEKSLERRPMNYQIMMCGVITSGEKLTYSIDNKSYSIPITIHTADEAERISGLVHQAMCCPEPPLYEDLFRSVKREFAT